MICGTPINRKILTWDSLQVRGFVGHGICCLCHKAEESSDHIFGNCSFFQLIGDTLCSCIKSPWRWDLSSLADNLQYWVKSLSLPLEIPALLIWEVWRTRNTFIFENSPVSITSPLSKGCSSPFFPNLVSSKQVGKPVHPPPVIWDGSVGYFDGVAEDGYCGAGMVIRMGNLS